MGTRRRTELALALGAAAIALQLVLVAFRLPGRLVVSDVLFVLVPLTSAVLCARASRRLTGAARLCWMALTGVEVAWFAANLGWAWYEVVLEQRVPVPSPADWFYSLALVLGVATMAVGLLPLVRSRIGAMRVLLDVVLVSGALLFIAWATLLDNDFATSGTKFIRTVTWVYPALGATACTVALAVMTRVQARFRMPWLVLGGGFLAGTIADTVWAYRNLNSDFSGGSFISPMWTVAYGAIGVSALAVRGDAGLASTRLTPARWESLGAYIPVTLAGVVALVQQLRGDLSAGMVTTGVLLVGVLLCRQLLAVFENHALAHTLESRVASRTAELRAGEAHFRTIVASISDIVLILDVDRNIKYQSPAVERMLGYGPAELIGQSVEVITHADDLAAGRRAAVQRAGDLAGVYVARIRRRDGSWRHMETTVTDLFDHPEVRGLVLAMRDVGERVELEERLRHQAFHDTLTGLANRALLYQELNALLAEDRCPSLLLLDLDEFKAVNDTAGHDLGDDVLVAVAGRLLDSVRPGDLVSRLGGDEFAVVMVDDPRTHAAVAVADRILHALRRPLVVQGRHVRCLGSIGVASSVAGTTAEGLLRDADVAMYEAKARGKGRIELFTSAMRERVVRRQHVEDLLRRAITERRLVLHYQPVVDLETEQFVGVEALLRLRDEAGELISPAEFVPIAEETGVVVEIGAWVLVEACRQMESWQALRPDGPPLDVAVNVSTRQLQDAGLVRSVAAALEVSGLDPSLLTLEITEGALSADEPGVDDILRSLRQLGVRLSIDDFGAGFSSLGRLRHLPVDELKIDRSFVGELDAEGDAPLVDAILAMAARLGLSVVAEGIETLDQSSYLRASTCDRGQGFLYARPMPAAEVAVVLADLSSSRRARSR